MSRQAEPKPLRADAQRNRARVLAAARDSFAADGASVPLDAIARLAGVGPGTVYRHFPTKEALFEAVVIDRMQTLVDHARSLYAADDPGAALLGLIRHIVDEAAPKQDLIDAIDRTGMQLSSTLIDVGAQLQTAVGRLLRRAQRAGGIRTDVGTDDVMLLIGGIIVGAQRHATVSGDLHTAVAVVCDGLAPQPR